MLHSLLCLDPLSTISKPSALQRHQEPARLKPRVVSRESQSAWQKGTSAEETIDLMNTLWFSDKNTDISCISMSPAERQTGRG